MKKLTAVRSTKMWKPDNSEIKYVETDEAFLVHEILGFYGPVNTLRVQFAHEVGTWLIKFTDWLYYAGEPKVLERDENYAKIETKC